ncbi:MAG: hypothetical protein ABIF71_05595 [Planctomycetota bacterium]
MVSAPAEVKPFQPAAAGAGRDAGMLIVHCPSDVMTYYDGTPQRRKAQTAPQAKASAKFQWNYFNPEREGPLEPEVEKGGCACDTPEPCNRHTGPPYPWTREHAAISMGSDDAVSQDGQEIYNLYIQAGIKHVIMTGVHTNACVLGRPFGIRQLVYLGMEVVLCRDLTDPIQRMPGRHFEGLRRMVEHIERYWCPSMTSDQVTGGKSFKFKTATDHTD